MYIFMIISTFKQFTAMSLKDLDERIGYLVGDVLIASAFLSYIGPFLSNYRQKLVVEKWITEVNKLQVPCDPNFNFCNFMVKPTQVNFYFVNYFIYSIIILFPKF